MQCPWRKSRRNRTIPEFANLTSQRCVQKRNEKKAKQKQRKRKAKRVRARQRYLSEKSLVLLLLL